MAIIGIIFLFPGGCALLFAIGTLVDFMQRGRTDPFIGAFATLWLFCFAISALGIFMIRLARKRERRSS